MSVTELENRIAKMQEWEQLAQDASAEAEAIRDTIKAEMLARDTEELAAGRFIVRWRSVLTSRFNSSEFKKAIGKRFCSPADWCIDIGNNRFSAVYHILICTNNPILIRNVLQCRNDNIVKPRMVFLFIAIQLWTIVGNHKADPYKWVFLLLRQTHRCCQPVKLPVVSNKKTIVAFLLHQTRHDALQRSLYLRIGCGQLAMTAKGTNSHIIAPLTTRNHYLRSFYYDFPLKSIYH